MSLVKRKETTKGLIIFIKNALPGNVKTRLAKDSSEEYALKVYEALLEHTRKVSLEVELDRYLYYSDHVSEGDQWSDSDFEKYIQADGDLGEKMTSAFEAALNKNDKVIIIGSDCIQLTPDIIHLAFEALDRWDVVIGPALDGGYYLLGMKSMDAGLFQDIQWSTSLVSDQTLEKVITSGKTCHYLPSLSDIDYLEDWKKYGYSL